MVMFINYIFVFINHGLFSVPCQLSDERLVFNQARQQKFLSSPQHSGQMSTETTLRGLESD